MMKLAEEPCFGDIITREQFQALALLINVSFLNIFVACGHLLMYTFKLFIPPLSRVHYLYKYQPFNTIPSKGHGADTCQCMSELLHNNKKKLEAQVK